jgi:hypothetical protein
MSTPSGGDVANRRTASDFAAGALLGALLLDPQRLNDVAAWLQPNDFPNWADRAVYATLLGLRRDGRDIDVLTVAQAVASGEYHDAHVDSSGIGPLSWPALHTLMHTTPATPHASVGVRPDIPDEPARSEAPAIPCEGSVPAYRVAPGVPRSTLFSAPSAQTRRSVRAV